MTVYAAYYAQGWFGGTRTGVRAWHGSGWTDLTANLNDGTFFNLDRGFAYISDLHLWKGQLFAILWSRGPGLAVSGRVLHYQKGKWEQTASVLGADGATLDGFIEVKGRLLIHGSTQVSGHDVFAFWDVHDNGHISLRSTGYNAATNDTFFIRNAWPRGTVVHPKHPERVIIGDAENDAFGYWNFDTGQFTDGSDPGGSCIFAMNIDKDGVVWSGDFFAFYYYSTDYGASFVTIDAEATGYPEVWDMAHWVNHDLYAVGCNPSKIIRRNSHPFTVKPEPNPRRGDSEVPGTVVPSLWETVYTLPHYGVVDRRRAGVGFMSCVPESDWGGQLIIGFGCEPYYYGSTDINIGAVYAWDGKELTDISHGLNWGDGVYRLVNDGANNLQSGMNFKSTDFW